jgi:hypothetical protein
MVPAARRLPIAVVLAATLAACGALGSSPVPTGPRALEPGTYRSQSFSPGVTFTLPAGWLILEDSANYFGLQPVSSNLIGIHLFRDPQPASQDLACPIVPEPGVGTAALAFVTWIRGLPGLAVGPPRPVTVGGLEGIQIDLAIADGWTASCPFANGLPTTPLFVGRSNDGFRWVVAGSERLRLTFLDLPNGGTVVVDVDAFDGSLWNDLIAAAEPIVASLEFAAP